MSNLPPYPRIAPQRSGRLRDAAKRYRERAAELRRTLQGVEAHFVKALDADDARKTIEQRLDAHVQRSGSGDARRLKLGARK